MTHEQWLAVLYGQLFLVRAKAHLDNWAQSYAQEIWDYRAASVILDQLIGDNVKAVSEAR